MDILELAVIRSGIIDTMVYIILEVRGRLVRRRVIGEGLPLAARGLDFSSHSQSSSPLKLKTLQLEP